MDTDFLAAVAAKPNGATMPTAQPQPEPEIFPVELVKQAASSIETACAELRSAVASIRAELDSIEASIELVEGHDNDTRKVQETYMREASDALNRLRVATKGVSTVLMQLPQTRLVQSNGDAA